MEIEIVDKSEGFLDPYEAVTLYYTRLGGWFKPNQRIAIWTGVTNDSFRPKDISFHWETTEGLRLKVTLPAGANSNLGFTTQIERDGRQSIIYYPYK